MLEQRNARTRRLRIWSAGCSSGEEAYTLAMLLKDSARFEDWDVEVHGTDISRRVLAIARQGEYGPSALRATPPDKVARYFIAGGREPRAGARRRARLGHLRPRTTCRIPSPVRCCARGWTPSSAAT